MSTGPAAVSFLVDAPIGWSADWAWGLPPIVLTILIHVFGISLLRERAVWHFNQRSQMRQPTAEFVVVMGAITLAVTILHAAEAGIWAWAYKSLGALPDYSTAMLYSLNELALRMRIPLVGWSSRLHHLLVVVVTAGMWKSA